MSGFDALIHALTTVATGGFSSHDASFAAMSGPAEYVASLYMVLAALPFVRFVQLLNGSARPIFTDEQIRGFVATLVVIIAFSTVYLIYSQNFAIEQAFRQALFNIISIMSGRVRIRRLVARGTHGGGLLLHRIDRGPRGINRVR